ncbi:MAG: hypothetical protein LBK02_10455 [Treponema sp.]|jgi:hypothetical protein|nr:hypothetical protein [Treponema sp.]
MNPLVKFFPLLGVFILGSCIGIEAGISVRGDGSGTMRLEYRISRLAESLGKLDGNEGWQTVPLGRADFERSLERLPGLRLVSFSSKDDGTDLITRAELEFKDIKDLIPFLAGAGQGAALVEENGKKRLSLIVFPGAGEGDGELLSLVRELARPYTFALSFSAPGAVELGLTDGRGMSRAAAEGVLIESSGKKSSLSVNVGDLLSSPEGLGAEIIWH